MDGIININKPKGLTSSQVVTQVKRAINVSKAGHTGTLDPNATGVLPICIGKATRLASIITSGNKTYKAELILGITTNTEDITGDIIKNQKVTQTSGEIVDAIMSFEGCISQVPPMYSAIKVNGNRLYTLARKGKVVERKARNVNIFSIRICEEVTKQGTVIEVCCSPGTYIRTLCNDIGKKLGCGATMGNLQRTKVSSFSINNAYNLQDLSYFAKSFLIPPSEVLQQYAELTIMQQAVKFLQNGNKISKNYVVKPCIPLKQNSMFRIYDSERNFFGLYKVINDVLAPEIYLG